MRMTKYTSWAVAIGLALSAAPASALTINDAGVVGTIEAGTGNGSSASNETEWSNYLLSLGANATTTADANTPLDGKPRRTRRDPTTTMGRFPLVPSQVRSGPTIPFRTLPASEYALVKYDGPNAGYVLYNVADFDGGSGNLPEFSYSIWGKAEQYQSLACHYLRRKNDHGARRWSDSDPAGCGSERPRRSPPLHEELAKRPERLIVWFSTNQCGRSKGGHIAVQPTHLHHPWRFRASPSVHRASAD